MINFIHNIGDYFASNYFDENFTNKVIEKSGFSAEAIKEIDKSIQKLPIIPEIYQPKFKVVATVTPDESELLENNRSRSAKLRVIQRVKQEMEKMRKTRRVKISKFEKLIYTLAIFLLVIAPVSIVFSKKIWYNEKNMRKYNQNRHWNPIK